MVGLVWFDDFVLIVFLIVLFLWFVMFLFLFFCREIGEGVGIDEIWFWIGGILNVILFFFYVLCFL